MGNCIMGTKCIVFESRDHAEHTTHTYEYCMYFTRTVKTQAFNSQVYVYISAVGR